MHLHAVIPLQTRRAFMHIALDNMEAIKEVVDRLFLVKRQIRTVHVSIMGVVHWMVIFNQALRKTTFVARVPSNAKAFTVPSHVLPAAFTLALT